MSASNARTLSPTGLVLWLRCPRRFWFEHVARAEPDHRLTGFAAPVGVAGHAGLRLLLAEPGATSERIRDAMLAAFEAELRHSQGKGRSYEPEFVGAALDRIEGEILDLVLRLGQSERVRAIDWTHTETRFEWRTADGRRLGATFDAIGVVREPITDFGARDGEAVHLDPGTRVLVDWKFGREPDVSRVGLSLNLQLAFYELGARQLFPQEPVRSFVAAVRQLLPRRPSDARGRPLPRFVEELNPAYLQAFAGGHPVDEGLRRAAEASRRRLFVAGAAIPKRVRRPNPAYEAQAGADRGPVFHEARIAWRVVTPTLANALHELDRAVAEGHEASFPARGPYSGACASCPFRGQCTASA